MIKIEHLHKTYDRHTRNANEVLSDISFTLPDTGFVCILGESGCGKTSLLNAIGGLDRFDSGEITAGGTKITRYGSRSMEYERNREFGYIFQNYHLLRDHSVIYNVYIGMHTLGLSHKERIARSKEALKNVGMEHYERRIVGTLSGGQQQRVAIARAIARKPKVIFADEPTGNLDEENTVNICTLLRKISAESLVVMVTHEERIARFFADRIIRIGEGKIKDDISGWDRNSLTFESTQTVYAGELSDTAADTGSVSLRVLCEEGAKPVEMTVIAQADRIIIKINDSRKITCAKNNELPKIVEGKMPEITFEETERIRAASAKERENLPAKRAGTGFTPSMVWREGIHVLKRRGSRSLITRIFLVLLTALAVFTAGDFMTVSHLDEHDFITTDSHLLSVTVTRGEDMAIDDDYALLKASDEFREFISASELDFEFIPVISAQPSYAEKVFPQMDSISATVGNFCYVPLSRLDSSALIYGRMPENSGEIVVDRWVLDKLLEKDGVVQNGIPDVSYFIGKSLKFLRRTYSPVISGICDNGSPAIYLNRYAFVSVSDHSSPVISFEEFQRLEPGKLELDTLAAGNCITLEKRVGAIWGMRIGRPYAVGNNINLTVASSYAYGVDTYASIVINDNDVDKIYDSLMMSRFNIYCADIGAMKDYIRNSLPEELKTVISLKVVDTAGDQWAKQRALAEKRVKSRVIVTVSVIAISLVMLWLMQRSRVHSCADMATVYRMLCIPKRKLVSVFALSALLDALIAALPAAVLTTAALKLISALPSLSYSVYLPWYISALVFAAIMVYHILTSVLPLLRMLRIPPARLSAKYDL